MKEFALSPTGQALILLVLTPLFTILTGFLSKLILAKEKQVTAKIKNDKFKHLIEDATIAVNTAVGSTLQTYVDSLKKSGSFDEAAQVKALNLAKDKALDLMLPEAKDLLFETYTSVDVWLQDKIEEAVRNKKYGGDC